MNSVRPSDLSHTPANLPVPLDDGAARHLAGRMLPALRLRSTGGAEVALQELGAGPTVLYCYPLTGSPGVALPEGWDAGVTGLRS